MREIKGLLNKAAILELLRHLKADRVELDNPKKILIVAFCFLLLYLDFTFIIKLQLNSINKVTPKIYKLKNDMAQLQRGLNNLDELRSNRSLTEEELLSQTKRLISEEQQAALFEQISDIATKNNVRISNMGPQKQAQSKKDKPIDKLKLTSFIIGLDLICAYHNLGKFINDLENLQSFIEVQELTIKSQQNEMLNQSVNLVLRTYVRE